MTLVYYFIVDHISTTKPKNHNQWSQYVLCQARRSDFTHKPQTGY